MNTILILLLENILNQQMQLQFKINRNNGGKLSITILLSMLENILITFLFKLRNRKCKKTDFDTIIDKFAAGNQVRKETGAREIKKNHCSNR